MVTGSEAVQKSRHACGRSESGAEWSLATRSCRGKNRSRLNISSQFVTTQSDEKLTRKGATTFGPPPTGCARKRSWPTGNLPGGTRIDAWERPEVALRATVSDQSVSPLDPSTTPRTRVPGARL